MKKLLFIFLVFFSFGSVVLADINIPPQYTTSITKDGKLQIVFEDESGLKTENIHLYSTDSSKKNDKLITVQSIKSESSSKFIYTYSKNSISSSGTHFFHVVIKDNTSVSNDSYFYINNNNGKYGRYFAPKINDFSLNNNILTFNVEDSGGILSGVAYDLNNRGKEVYNLKNNKNFVKNKSTKLPMNIPVSNLVKGSDGSYYIKVETSDNTNYNNAIRTIKLTISGVSGKNNSSSNNSSSTTKSNTSTSNKISNGTTSKSITRTDTNNKITTTKKAYDFTLNKCNDITSKVKSSKHKNSNNVKVSICIDGFPLSGQQEFSITDKYIYFSRPVLGSASKETIGNNLDGNLLSKIKSNSNSLSTKQKDVFERSYYKVMMSNSNAKNIIKNKITRLPRKIVYSTSEAKTMYIDYGGHGHGDVYTNSSNNDIIYINGIGGLNYHSKKKKYTASHKGFYITYFKESTKENSIIPSKAIQLRKNGNKIRVIKRSSNESTEEYAKKVLNNGLYSYNYQSNPNISIDKNNNKVYVGNYILKLSDFLNNNANVLKRVCTVSDIDKVSSKEKKECDIITQSEYYGQGRQDVAISGNYLYLLHSVNEPTTIIKYNISNGKEISRVVIDFNKLFKQKSGFTDKECPYNSETKCTGEEAESIYIYKGRVYINVYRRIKQNNRTKTVVDIMKIDGI